MDPYTTRSSTVRHLTRRVTKGGVPIVIESQSTRTLRPVAELFMEKVEKVESGCWLWRGYVDKHSGYGKYRMPGERSNGAHRAAWRIFRGEIPEGKQIDHLCWVRNCVNPEHLRTVSAKENNYNTRARSLKFCPNGHNWTMENTGNGGGYIYCIPCAEAAK